MVVGAVPELHTEPIRLALHLAAECVTAVGLIISGIALLQGKTWGTRAYPAFAGMVFYSEIVSSGYVAQRSEWALVAMLVMFVVLLILVLISLMQPLRARR